MTASETYRVYTIQYADHARRSSQNFLDGSAHDVARALDYFLGCTT